MVKKGHPNCITGSKVTAILLNGWILPIGEASSVKDLRLQPAQIQRMNERMKGLSFTSPAVGKYDAVFDVSAVMLVQ